MRYAWHVIHFSLCPGKAPFDLVKVCRQVEHAWSFRTLGLKLTVAVYLTYPVMLEVFNRCLLFVHCSAANPVTPRPTPAT